MEEHKKEEKYDMMVHVPQQIENLLQARAQVNSELFNHVLSGLYVTLKENDVFVDGVDQDQQKLQDGFEKTFTGLRNRIKTAGDVENDMDMVNHVKQAVALFDNEYSVLQQQFMDDVLQTCVTFVQLP